jgi:hypothetical protein
LELAILSILFVSPQDFYRLSWSLVGLSLMVILPLVPWMTPKRFRVRIGTSIAGILSAVFAWVILRRFQQLYITGGEGPNGEGSPLAALMGMFFLAGFFLIPWGITLVRGIGRWKIQTEHAVTQNGEDLR